MTPEEYHALAKSKKPSKYRAIRTHIDGIIFASKREAARYQSLKDMVFMGEIDNLELQPAFDLIVNGIKIGRYIGDFRYIDKQTGATIIEDAKSKITATPVYRLKKRLMWACHSIEIKEV